MVDIAYQRSEEIRGEKIVLVARRLSKISLVNETHRHKANSISGTDNAKAWIERPLSYIRNRASE